MDCPFVKHQGATTRYFSCDYWRCR